ncbi:MAG: YciE/YciF ferroxidase family protein [Longimicrobiales bacterium]
MESMQKLYLEELRDIYDAEKQLEKALPKMAKGVSHDKLRTAFEEHLETTKEQVRRLETIFDNLGESPTGKKCKGMQGLIEEGEEIMKEEGDPDVKDAAIISAAQRVEHYEIAAYGSLRTYADELGLKDHAELLQRSLDEEGNTDKRLTQMAESRINKDATVGR